MAEQQPKKRGRRLLNRPQQLTAAQKKRIIEVFDEKQIRGRFFDPKATLRAEDRRRTP